MRWRHIVLKGTLCVTGIFTFLSVFLSNQHLLFYTFHFLLNILNFLFISSRRIKTIFFSWCAIPFRICRAWSCFATTKLLKRGYLVGYLLTWKKDLRKKISLVFRIFFFIDTLLTGNDPFRIDNGEIKFIYILKDIDYNEFALIHSMFHTNTSHSF